MKRPAVAHIFFSLILIFGSASLTSADVLDEYLTGFTYQEPKDNPSCDLSGGNNESGSFRGCFITAGTKNQQVKFIGHNLG